VASRLETAVRMNTVTKSMKGVVKGMDKGLASMDVDKISATMDKFERQFEDLDVKAAYMDTAMNATTASATPVDQVDELVMMVADENNLRLGEEFSDLRPVGRIKEPEKKVEEEVAPLDLEARLANLRG
jgi:charged multivesicular body protein 1